MKILGINIGIGASVCLIDNEKIVCAMQEERITKEKNFMGFPEESLQYLCVNYPKIISTLDAIAVPGFSTSEISKKEFLKVYQKRDCKDTLLNRLRKNKSLFLNYLSLYKNKFFKKNYQNFSSSNTKKIENILSNFGNYKNKIFHFNHHLCHAATVYYSLAKDPNEKYLLLTLDGGGDGECATVSVASKGKIKRIATTLNGNSIGNIYSNVTQVLGFTPHEHEYKLMGLASYVPRIHAEKARQIFNKYLKLDNDKGLIFKRNIIESTGEIAPRLRKDFRKIRFDNMAAGLQVFTEEIVLNWVKNAIKETGIKKVLCSGGVFMNIKLNKLISELDEIDSVDVFPSCGDESNVFGAAFLMNNKLTGKSLFDFGQYTLGPNSDFDLQEAMKKYKNICSFEEIDNPNQAIAESIASGKIIGRCSGPMEFGARALGNRSILADPSSHEIVEKVNFLIKQRDFWMPFAPAIRKEDSESYLKIPKSLSKDRISPYMMFGFDTTRKNRSHMVATIHRADKTARCEIVNKDISPGLHEILTIFKEKTGRGVIMNTSLNIHGDPIAMGTMDAIHILLNSDLEEVYINNYLVKKL